MRPAYQSCLDRGQWMAFLGAKGPSCMLIEVAQLQTMSSISFGSFNIYFCRLYLHSLVSTPVPSWYLGTQVSLVHAHITAKAPVMISPSPGASLPAAGKPCWYQTACHRIRVLVVSKWIAKYRRGLPISGWNVPRTHCLNLRKEALLHHSPHLISSAVCPKLPLPIDPVHRRTTTHVFLFLAFLA